MPNIYLGKKIYLGKMEYALKIITPDCETARMILSDEKIELKNGDIVYVDGAEYRCEVVKINYDFDKYIQTYIVYLGSIGVGEQNG